MNAIEISHLTKSYGKSRGIIDVSLNVNEGEIFGFIGPNGAGKSTTIRSLLALIYPNSCLLYTSP
ncbi:MAG: ATP-binding cassette domain-containing protein, partial [Clostridia bacterium]|nr:ATP-binding cassette domain-containing protein [Clostridia bacterium]